MKRVLFFLVVLAAMGLTSCGGGGPTTTINVTLIDFQFTPNQFTVPAGQEITINVVNTGAVVHNFVIMKLGTTAGPTFEEDDEANVYWQERDIPPGGDISVKLPFDVPAGTEPKAVELHDSVFSGGVRVQVTGN